MKRINYQHAAPGALGAIMGLERYVRECGLEEGLIELIKIRASQINGCAYCLDLHTKHAMAIGEDPQRLHVLAAWREADFYNARERAALAWCESLTRLPDTGAADADFEWASAQFSPQELVALTTAIVTINGWNRFAVGFRTPVGGGRK